MSFLRHDQERSICEYFINSLHMCYVVNWLENIQEK